MTPLLNSSKPPLLEISRALLMGEKQAAEFSSTPALNYAQRRCQRSDHSAGQ